MMHTIRPLHRQASCLCSNLLPSKHVLHINSLHSEHILSYLFLHLPQPPLRSIVFQWRSAQTSLTAVPASQMEACCVAGALWRISAPGDPSVPTATVLMVWGGSRQQTGVSQWTLLQLWVFQEKRQPTQERPAALWVGKDTEHWTVLQYVMYVCNHSAYTLDEEDSVF